MKDIIKSTASMIIVLLAALGFIYMIYQVGYQQGGGYQQQPAQQQPAQQTPNFARDPQRQQQQQGSFFQGSTTNPIDISDDDLPF